MTPEEFRAAGRAAIDWIADYLEGVERFPVASPVVPGSVRAALPANPPTDAEPFAALLRDLDDIVLPGLTHWQHPKFFAYFPSNTSYASILGDLLCAGLAVNGMSWATSPAGTEVEALMLDWMADLLGLPERFRSHNGGGPGGGVIQDTASSATLCALLAARERATGGRTNRTGTAGDLVVYATSETHSSLQKAARIAGIGDEQVRAIPVDAAYAMRPDALAQAMAGHRAAGRQPCFVIATVGTTSSLALDPVAAVAEVCQREGVWLHVDAAMAGIAALCPELRWIQAGLEGTDSYCTNPHKWMGVGFDCDLFYVADRSALIGALAILPEYLKTGAGDVIDYRDWQIPLGRRFRALKLWSVLRVDGVAAIQAMIRHHVAWAQELAAWAEADERFVVAAPHPLNLVCLRHRDGDARTDALVQAANATGEALFTRTTLGGESVLRVCVGASATE